MPTEHIPFFAAEANLTVLQVLLTRLPESPEIERKNPDSRLYLRQIVNNIVNNVHSFDKLCTWTIEKHGSSFIDEARNYDTLHNSEELFALAYYFLCELEFEKQDNLNRDLRQIKSFIDDNLHMFPDNKAKPDICELHAASNFSKTHGKSSQYGRNARVQRAL